MVIDILKYQSIDTLQKLFKEVVPGGNKILAKKL
jgi:hypothetical protein